MHLKLGSLVLVALFALVNLSCSGKTDEDDFNVDIVPESPFLSKGQRKLDTDNDGLIDETIELARKFGSAQSAQFVNGIMDKLIPENRKQ